MNYRILEINDGTESRFFPQYYRFGIWWYCRLYGWKADFYDLDQAQYHIEQHCAKPKNPMVKIHEIDL